MKRLLTTLLVLSFVLTPFAQKKNSKHREKARTTQTPVRKKTSTPASGKRKGTEAKPQRAATARTKTSGNRQSTPASKQLHHPQSSSLFQFFHPWTGRATGCHPEENQGTGAGTQGQPRGCEEAVAGLACHQF